MVEFTGERVIPGLVNADLWSEHVARYAFARRYVDRKRVLDCGCGSGYGAAELAQSATAVTGIDNSADALDYARENYSTANSTFLAASALDLPFARESFDVITAFELIEHLSDYRRFLSEAARVLAPGGLFIVSTPNKAYYAESRAQTGPNPFHEHEFEGEEFGRELSAFFPRMIFFLQNRVESFAFHSHTTFWPADARIDRGGGTAVEAHFFVALCGNSTLPPERSFVYVPKAANVLREREQHIEALDRDLGQTRRERDCLIAMYDAQKKELEEHNRWADRLNADLKTAQARIAQLQQDFAAEQASAREVVAKYEAKLGELEAENEAKTHWAMDTETRLTAEIARLGGELTKCGQLLTAAETSVEERTKWAQRLDGEKQALEAQLNLLRVSRWLKLGRKLGLGPVVR